ncbi:MAG: glycosyltransferase family 4 protein [Candidatus Aureabacteria bacterium]|nr:glycosyltransferase family 4 protein [Candidatus Auribacterota bacterium]
MISVLINALLYSEKVRSGANLQLEKLFFDGPANPGLNYYLLFNNTLSDEKFRILKEVKGLVPIRIEKECRGIFNRYFQTKNIIRQLCREYSIQLYHAFHLPVLKIKGIKTLLTIHDMRHSHTPYTTFYKKTASRFMVPFHLKGIDRVITVSEFSKQLVQKYYHVPLENISVIPNGIENVKEAPFSHRGKIICSVGHFEERKNQLDLIEAFSSSFLAKEYQLVLIGKINDASYYRKCLQIKTDRISFLVGAGEDEKNEIYSKAELAVLPSLYEGFGITLLEAMQFNLKILASDIQAFREIAGSSVKYFKIGDQKDLVEKLNLIAQIPRENYGSILGRFDWRDSRMHLEQIYLELGNE